MSEMGEQARQRTSRVPMVFYEKDLQPLWRTLRSAGSQASGSDSPWQTVQRYLKRSAETPATALRFDFAMVKIDQMLRNREAQAKPAKLAGHRSIRLLKWREQRCHPVGFNSNAVVSNFETETATLIVRSGNGDVSAWRSEFYGVVHQIPKYLLKADAISQNVMFVRVQFGRELQFLRRHGGTRGN